MEGTGIPDVKVRSRLAPSVFESTSGVAIS